MMDVEVKKQAKLPLLSRERVTGFTYFEGTTPSMKDVKQMLAKKIKANEAHVVVRHIYQKYGEQKAKFIAHVYENNEMLKKFEALNLLKKNGLVQVEEAKPEAA
ncbi:hypothetical protein HZC31_02995 [Candidatus Woesearchaeota archaeon]|nr:hypothetical protein [Candidatus Woesearchaeota archaeon]